MRWFVSIGAVLVVGLMAGFAVVAAPGPQLAQQRADSDANAVDVQLVLAVDVSYSMDMDELAIQREGYAQAIVSKDFLQALADLLQAVVPAVSGKGETSLQLGRLGFSLQLLPCPSYGESFLIEQFLDAENVLYIPLAVHALPAGARPFLSDRHD